MFVRCVRIVNEKRKRKKNESNDLSHSMTRQQNSMQHFKAKFANEQHFDKKTVSLRFETVFAAISRIKTEPNVYFTMSKE